MLMTLFLTAIAAITGTGSGNSAIGFQKIIFRAKVPNLNPFFSLQTKIAALRPKFQFYDNPNISIVTQIESRQIGKKVQLNSEIKRKKISMILHQSKHRAWVPLAPLPLSLIMIEGHCGN